MRKISRERLLQQMNVNGLITYLLSLDIEQPLWYCLVLRKEMIKCSENY